MRPSLRRLLRQPGFTLTAVGVLALGIGIATAMFSVLNAELLRPLPYLHPDQLVTVAEPRGATEVFWGVSHLDALDWQRSAHSLQQIAFTQPALATLQTEADSTSLEADTVSANLFALLGVPPALGRAFAAQDAAARSRLAVLSDALWRSAFHADRGVVGTSIKLDGTGYVVAGVMPPAFRYPYDNSAALWTLYLPPATPTKEDRTDTGFSVIARLAPGTSIAAAQAEVSAIQAGIARRFAGDHLTDRVVVRSYKDSLVAHESSTLWAVALAVGFVWLIACASVAGLLLSRFAARRRELAVRAALGASRARLARGLLGEALLVGGAAGAAGCGVAALCLGGLRPFLSRHFLDSAHIRLNPMVLAALVAASLLSVVVVGLLPALAVARVPAAQGLADRSAAGSPAQARLRDALVVAEIALALLLLAGAGLLLRTLHALRQVPLGFTTANILTVRLNTPRGSFAHDSVYTAFEAPLLARIEAMPGVAAAAVSSVLPLAHGVQVKGMFGIEGRHNLTADQQPQGDLRFTSPDYPKTFGIVLERGRFFDPRLDTATSQPVVVVNHTFAARYFPGQDAVGQHLSIGPKKYAEIIGVLADARDISVAEPPAPQMHFSTTQLAPGKAPFYNIGAQFLQLGVRTRTPSEASVPAIRAAIHALRPDLAPGTFQTMTQLEDLALGDQTFAARLLSLFALAALAIALAGLYGLLAYQVGQRTREMGIRVALGADRSDIVGLVLRRALWPLGLGVALGLGLALALARLLAAYLFGVPARDPWTLAAVALLLAACGLAAAWLPARRAAAVSPLTALHAE